MSFLLQEHADSILNPMKVLSQFLSSRKLHTESRAFSLKFLDPVKLSEAPMSETFRFSTLRSVLFSHASRRLACSSGLAGLGGIVD